MQAIKKNKQHMPYAKYVQLATIKKDGRPSNRTVVYRYAHTPDNAPLCRGASSETRFKLKALYALSGSRVESMSLSS